MGKYSELISQLEDKTKTMCGIGTRLVKLFLNAQVKKGDERACLYRQLLECEMDNINAKRYHNTRGYKYSDQYYAYKKNDIDRLICDLLESNPLKVTFGYEKSDVWNVKHIIYFDVPDCGQISFHTDIAPHLMRYVEPYKGKWDGQVNSTLIKLEKGILTNYKEAIKEKYPKQIAEYEEYIIKKQEQTKRKKIRKLYNKILKNTPIVFTYTEEQINEIINNNIGNEETKPIAKTKIEEIIKNYNENPKILELLEYLGK